MTQHTAAMAILGILSSTRGPKVVHMPGMWARLRADLNIRLRRGAWYRITQLGPLQAVVDVRGRSLAVPSAFLQVVDSPPRTWSVVARPSDAIHLPRDFGDRYAVCPSCRARQAIDGRPRALACHRCGGEFRVTWVDA